jgi:hypothetical protein
MLIKLELLADMNERMISTKLKPKELRDERQNRSENLGKFVQFSARCQCCNELSEQGSRAGQESLGGPFPRGMKSSPAQTERADLQ